MALTDLTNSTEISSLENTFIKTVLQMYLFIYLGLFLCLYFLTAAAEDRKDIGKRTGMTYSSETMLLWPGLQQVE